MRVKRHALAHPDQERKSTYLKLSSRSALDRKCFIRTHPVEGAESAIRTNGARRDPFDWCACKAFVRVELVTFSNIIDCREKSGCVNMPRMCDFSSEQNTRFVFIDFVCDRRCWDKRRSCSCIAYPTHMSLLQKSSFEWCIGVMTSDFPKVRFFV
jgi:hypothetical protein